MSTNAKEKKISNHPISGLHEFQEVFSPIIKQFFLDQKVDNKSFDPVGDSILEHLAEFTLRGGQRIRPALLYYTYQGLTKANTDPLLPLMVSCELMQSFFLIHDDIMDEAELRRGGETIHQIFYKELACNNLRPAESIAILAGNIAGYLGIQAISGSDLQHQYKWRVMELYAKTCIDVNYGQTLDIVSKPLGHLTEDFIYKIYYYKTACYTTEFPLLCAAILTDCDEKTQEVLKEIGKHMGILFQARDDLLGIFSSPSVIGKCVISDVQQGKKTLLICKAWEKGTKEQREYLEKVYGERQAGLKEAMEIRNIMIDTGSLEYVQNVIQEHAKQAKIRLDNLHFNNPGKIFIQNLINYLSDVKVGLHV